MAEPLVSLDVSAPRSCLRGHHQCRRRPSSTRTASGNSRRRPQRSRHAAIAGLAAPLVGPADSATSRHGRALAFAPVGRPGLCGHHQRPRDRSSTQMASGDARGPPQRSRHAAIAGLAAPLVGPADIATSPQRRCSRCIRNMQIVRTGELENNIKVM